MLREEGFCRSCRAVILWFTQPFIHTPLTITEGMTSFEISFTAFSHALLIITEGMTSFEDVVMSGKIASTKWRIILTWLKKPKDLDSHTKFGDCDVYHFYHELSSAAASAASSRSCTHKDL